MQLPEVTRRSFLRGTLRGAGAVALVPMLAVGCAPERTAAAPRDLRVLGVAEWSLLDTIADTFVPRGGAFALGARDLDLATRIDAYLANERPEIVRGVRGALLLVEWASPLASGRLGRFSALDVDARIACIDALRTSRSATLREVFAGLKTLCLFLFYAADESWTALGYDGPLVGRRVVSP
ncbi:MAG: gluconate 2-dehydrogenase subunit 3 family protein [Myxococcota bacterium]|jgi:hypothetical protein|nr:gluconate 2-dehydrogenase subunit 3 family protein [Myxococcota bacterium]